MPKQHRQGEQRRRDPVVVAALYGQGVAQQKALSRLGVHLNQATIATSATRGRIRMLPE